MSNTVANPEVNEILADISVTITAEEIAEVKSSAQRVGDAYAACNRGLVVFHEDSCSKDEY